VRNLDKCAIVKPAPPAGSVQVRSPSGHLVGILDRQTLILEVKPRSGRPAEQIDLKPLIKGEG
jgi:hypothetical protein